MIAATTFHTAARLPFVALTVTASLLAASCAHQDATATPPQTKVSIGIQVSPAMTSVMVAQDERFFQQAGLDVELKEFTAGKFALQAFLSGSIDFAVSGEVPVALAALQGNPMRIVSQVVEATTNEVRVVARRDAHAAGPADYFAGRKKKLATSFGGGPEFFAYTFLKHYGIDSRQVEILSQRPEDMPAALESGSVDAIAIFDPFAFIAERRLGDKGVTFADDALYSELYVLAARPESIDQQSEVIDAVLRALLAAGDFIERDPEKAKQIVQKYTKLDRTVIDGIWPNFVFRPALTERLVQYWEAQAAWAKATAKVTPETQIPDFRKLIDARFLGKLKPEAVKLNLPPQ